jgi:hypothetical protein
MHIEVTGSETERHYAITGISNEQYRLLMRALTTHGAGSIAKNRTGQWRNNSADITVVVADGRTAEEADNYLRRNVGGPV